MCDEQYKYGLNTYEAKLSWVAIQTDQPENKMRDQAPGEHFCGIFHLRGIFSNFSRMPPFFCRYMITDIFHAYWECT